jgi:hypothetical protein
VTDRTDPYEIIGVRRDASLAEIRISYRRSTQILAPERFASVNETVRAEAARRLAALNSAMESIEAERAAESGSALGSLSFRGPAVSPAAEPSMRSTAVVDEPPPVQQPEAPPEVVAGAVEAPERGAAEPVSELAEPPVAAPAAPEPAANATAQGDTEDDLPLVGEETGEVPVVVADPEPEAAPAPVAAPAATPAPAPRRTPPRERTTRKAPRERSLVPRLLAAAAVVVALAAVGAYFLLSGGSSSTKPAGGRFEVAGAPVSFDYPSDLVRRRPPRGGLLKPTFSTAVGLGAANYVVVATYRISAAVQSDGSAIGAGGSRLTADRFDQSVDRAADRIAAAQKLKPTSPVQPGKAGDLIARIYGYTRPDGSSARYAFAFRGHTEYSIACFWDPAHAATLSAACDQVMSSLQRL